MATILIIEDLLLTREFLVTILSLTNHHLLEAVDSRAALKIAKSETIDLIITDVLTPTVDGFDFINQLHMNPDLEKIPVIFYTATYSMKEARSLAKNCGVCFVLKNPSKPKIILETVQKALVDTQSLSADKLIPLLKDIPIGLSPITSTEITQLNKSLPKRFSEIKSIRKTVQTFINSSLEAAKEHQLSLDKINTLSKNLKQMQIVTDQLINMIKVNLDLFQEKDPSKFLRSFCKGAQKVLGTKYFVLGIFNEKSRKLKHFLVSEKGVDLQTKIDLQALLDKGLIERILKQRSSIKTNDRSAIQKLDLFPNHPLVTSFLGFPIFSKTHLYGFIYFADKIDGTIFNDEDLLIGGALVSGLSVLYENLIFQEMIQHHAAKLQLEINKRKIIQLELDRSEKFIHQFAENIEDVFWQINPEMDKIIYVSPAYEKVWGKTLESCYANPQQWFDSIFPEDQPMVKEAFDRLRRKEVRFVSLEYRITRQDGAVRYIFTRGFNEKDKNGKVLSLLGIDSDITEYKQIKNMISAGIEIVNVLKTGIDIKFLSKKLLEIICGSLKWDLSIMWMIDPKINVLRCIDTWKANNVHVDSFIRNSFDASYKKGQGFLGRVWQNRRGHWIPDLASDPHFLRTVLAKKEKLRSCVAVPIAHQDKIYGVVAFYSSKHQEHNTDLLHILENLGVLIGEFIYHKHTKSELIEVSRHDALTGLINYGFFKEKIIDFLKTSPPLLALIVLDIDRFKKINEALGHEAGDLLLQALAEKLRKLVSHKKNAITRLGADQFVLAIGDVQNINQIMVHILNIQNLFKDPFSIKGQDISINVSMGVSLYPENGTNLSVLLQKADIALEQAKTQGGNHFQFSGAIRSSTLADKLSLEMDLRKAILEKQFCLYYQPKVDLKTGHICGAEALIRWQHPEKGLLAPASFIPLAEESGLIISLEEWVLNEVFRQIKDRELFENDDTSVPISINLSIGQFNEQYNLTKYIEKLIKKFDINPKLIEFEITESILAKNIEPLLKFINPIKKWGIRLSLDDFGTGYSSLKYLQRFSIDRIKIDKSFVNKIPQGKHNLAIVKAIIALAHSFEIPVIAEGVETEEQLKCLIKENCDEMQGYYFSKPQSADQIKKMVMEGKRLILPS